MTTTPVRIGAALAATGLLLGVLSACAPEPEPTPTKTALFASDEEAFAAAEETYRAYTRAINSVDVSDPSTFEEIFQYATDDLETVDRKGFSEIHAQGLTMTGSISVLMFHGIDADLSSGEITANVCIDVSKSDLIDASGQSRISPSRPDLNPARVEFTTVKNQVLISRTDRDETISCTSE